MKDAEETMGIIEFDNVSYRYASHDDRPVLDDVSLSIEKGDFIAVIGANGSGKSTLAKHINALLKPTAGRVLTLGLDTADDELLFEIRSHAGMVFQNPDSQIVTSVIADDVAFGPENLAIPYNELTERVDKALDIVKMRDFSERNPVHLSGGQKQRCCIAGVLAMQPDVLILDEPCAMLDVRGRRGIRRLVRELNEMGITIILITHFMEEAVIAKQVYVVDKGRVAITGSPAEVFSNKTLLRELNLDVPFSLLLAEELIKRGVSVPEIARPEELKEELCRLYSTT
jgi:energy-coupling factor transporter ATPase